MLISEYNRETILHLADRIWDSVSCFRGKARKEQFLVELESSLKNLDSGLMENVCHNCLGTGYNNNGDLNEE